MSGFHARATLPAKLLHAVAWDNGLGAWSGRSWSGLPRGGRLGGCAPEGEEHAFPDEAAALAWLDAWAAAHGAVAVDDVTSPRVASRAS